MLRFPFICLGIILCLALAVSAESPLEHHLQASSSNISMKASENEESSAFVLLIKITNYIYNQSLEDHNSDDYVTLSGEVINMFQQVYASINTYQGVADMTFRNGSVIANSTLVFSTTGIDGDIVKFMFCNAFTTGPEPQTSLIVDPTYTLNLQAPVPVPIPAKTTTPQPTTTPLFSVPTTHQRVNSTAQHYSNISSSTHDSDLSKVTSPSHNVPDSTYRSTTDPITATATSLSSHVTNGLNSSSATSSKNNSELTHSATPSSHFTVNYSDTTLSKNATDSMNSTTSPLPSHATNGISSFTTTVSENATESMNNTKNPPLINTSHITRVSRDSSSSPPKATTSITKPIHRSTTSKSDTTSTPSGTVNPHRNTTAMTKHPASHTYTPPKVSTNVTSSRNHSHINLLSTTKPNKSSSMASSSYEGVPGWAIALLVLVSLILLLLIIFFILALWYWCCHREETGLINVTGGPKLYDREPSAPEFLTMDPYRKIYPEEFEKPKKNRTGMYVVNP